MGGVNPKKNRPTASHIERNGGLRRSPRAAGGTGLAAGRPQGQLRSWPAVAGWGYLATN